MREDSRLVGSALGSRLSSPGMLGALTTRHLRHSPAVTPLSPWTGWDSSVTCLKPCDIVHSQPFVACVCIYEVLPEHDTHVSPGSHAERAGLACAMIGFEQRTNMDGSSAAAAYQHARMLTWPGPHGPASPAWA